MNYKDFLYFNKADRTVLLFCLVIGAIATGLIFFVGNGKETVVTQQGDTVTTGHAEKELVTERKGQNGAYYYQGEAARPERFPFDPNTADSTELLRLGLQPWQVRSIYKYRAKGGIFRQPSDFARLYGLTQKQYRELLPYIRIGSDYRPAAELVENDRQSYYPREGSGYGEGYERGDGSVNDFAARRQTNASNGRAMTATTYPHKIKLGEHISLNTADTTALMRVPGIGPYYARRIVRYRQRLGGFTSVKQLAEIENFPDEALPYFVTGGPVKKLNVNKLSLKELKSHPYLNYYQARAIVDYRRLYGPLKSLSQLRLHPDFTEKDLKRLEGYVEF
ncbi:MAG: ComEA family DNA-binding protein [Prevotella sp.]|jgi:DNA uptake protein ComE-like DNA-binding protein